MRKIPKKIHYCWFGGNPLPELALKCIASWKEKLPDYEIIEWNEKNFDINYNVYVKEAYDSKKWAFVSDVARLYALYNVGGIYMDTDVEVLKSLDKFLVHEAFSGFENNNSIPTGIMASHKNNSWIKKLLLYYDDRHFINADGSLDITTNVTSITNVTKENYTIEFNDTFQDLQDVVFYPHEFFCPKDWKTGNILITDNTYTIHHFNSSWLSSEEKKIFNKRQELNKKYGVVCGKIFYSFYILIFDFNHFKAMLKKRIKNEKS